MTTRNEDIWNNRFARLLLESMAEGVFTLDAEGRVTSWNPSMEAISGYRSREVMGQSCRVLEFSRCFAKSCPKDMARCGIFKYGTVEPIECALRHKDGRMVPIIKNARVVQDEDGQAIGVVETVTDLSEVKRAKQKAEEASRRLGEFHRLGNLIGKSHGMQEVYAAIKAAAASSATVLIQGESGTGKELVAGAIHYNSDAAENPLITVNCSALAESLLESELFGHVRGAFTGALRDRIGRFEEADGGTIFLDEIGEITPYIQVKLLRVIQEREIERVGDNRKRKIDLRIIAASNRDLVKLVRDGRFREDLYYRLKVFPIHLPPLRKRKEDIPLLADHFIRRFGEKTGRPIQGISPAAMRLFMDHSWPGNVRELENAIEHAFVLCAGPEIDLSDLPIEIRQTDCQQAPLPEQTFSRKVPSARFTRESLLSLLEACDWNKAEVGRRTGKSRTAIWKYMKKWAIPLENPGQP